MSGTKYRGTATYMYFVRSTGATVDIYTENRSFQVQEQAQRIDVTVRGDSAKAFIADVPEITIQTGGLDTSGTPAWNVLQIGEGGTLVWAPSGTATGERKHTLKSIVQNKGYQSAYDGVAEWTLEFASDGGTVTQATW